MSLNLYDLLDVEETATAEEIRAAWKAAIADLDPTDRRFRAYNDAAGVLLDPARRAEYDAGLAEAEAAEEAAEAETAEAEAAGAAAAEEAAGEEPAVAAEKSSEPAVPEPAVAEPVVEERTAADRPAPDGPPRWALVLAAVAAVLLLVLTVALLRTPGASAEESPKEVAQRTEVQERAAVSAEDAAEKMVAPVLSYDHRTMAEDLERIQSHMTQQMADKQAAAWPELTKEAVAQRIVVEASAAGTALTRVAPDGERATVVVFIDQVVQKARDQPFVLRMWATLSLVRADGSADRWLLDDLCTEDNCG